MIDFFLFSFYNYGHEVKVRKMDNSDLVSFTSVVAVLLLLDRDITSLEISNFLSLLDSEGIVMDDNNDDIGMLLLCVQDKGRFSYSIKKELSYDTKIAENITVYDFLESFVDKRIFDILKSQDYYLDKYKKSLLFSRNIKDFNSSLEKNNFSNSVSDNKVKLKKVKKKNPLHFIIFGEFN